MAVALAALSPQQVTLASVPPHPVTAGTRKRKPLTAAKKLKKRERDRNYRLEHYAAINRNQQKWRDNHREAIAEKNVIQYGKNREKRIANSRAYRKKMKEKKEESKKEQGA